MSGDVDTLEHDLHFLDMDQLQHALEEAAAHIDVEGVDEALQEAAAKYLEENAG